VRYDLRVTPPAVPVFYSPAYTAAAHGFDTTRKATWIATALLRDPIPGVRLVEPEPIDEPALALVHDPAYVRAVRTGEPRALAESQGFRWDPGMWPMVCASNGGAIAAALRAARGPQKKSVAGSLLSGLHHARRGRGAGFCTFNGLALAAQAVLEDGAASALVLDLDAHCGGGTHELCSHLPGIFQTDVSVCDYDAYAPGERATLDVVRSAGEYLPTVAARLAEHERAGRRFDLCLYNAGMDPFEHCVEGGLNGVTAELLAAREELVFRWCAERHVPVAFVMAGGYTGSQLDEAGLVALHRLTIAAAARFAC
jgi:acetoin utilization deacetylase AcuC-like enzyme